MATLHGLPVYYVKVNEDLNSKNGIEFISLVDCPAIETNWVALSKDKPLKFSTDNDRQILAGPILITDQPIYRYDENGVEYWVVFKKEEIEKLVRKFQASQKTINLNYQHQKDSQLSSAVIQEIWLTGTNDKSKDFGFDLPAGSAFVCAHIGDKKFWDEEVKSGKVMGFSIEGFLDMELKKKHGQFTEVKVANDNSIFIDGEIEVGSFVYYNSPQIVLINGQKSEIKNLVWESNITLQDGTVLSVANGKIIEINKTQMSSQKFITAKTDKGVELTCDGETFAAGNEIYMMVNGEKKPCEDGEYKMENGSTIKVAAGKITEVVDGGMDDSEAEQIIQKAVRPLIETLKAELKTEREKFEARIKELETKLSKTPGAAAATSTTDGNEAGKPNTKQQLFSALEVFRKKDKEINSKPTK